MSLCVEHALLQLEHHSRNVNSEIITQDMPLQAWYASIVIMYACGSGGRSQLPCVITVAVKQRQEAGSITCIHMYWTASLQFNCSSTYTDDT